MTFWEVATSVEFAIATEFDNHRMPAEFAVKTSRFILDLNFFNLGFSFCQFFFKRFVEGIDDALPLLFTFFDLVKLKIGRASCRERV